MSGPGGNWTSEYAQHIFCESWQQPISWVHGDSGSHQHGGQESEALPKQQHTLPAVKHFGFPSSMQLGSQDASAQQQARHARKFLFISLMFSGPNASMAIAVRPSTGRLPTIQILLSWRRHGLSQNG